MVTQVPQPGDILIFPPWRSLPPDDPNFDACTEYNLVVQTPPNSNLGLIHDDTKKVTFISPMGELTTWDLDTLQQFSHAKLVKKRSKRKDYQAALQRFTSEYQSWKTSVIKDLGAVAYCLRSCVGEEV